VKSKETIKVED